MDNAMNELWKAQQDAATRLTESWRTMLQPASAGTATATTDDPARQIVDAEPAEATEPEPEPEPSVVDAFQAIRALRDGQRDLAQHLARWAELQRDLADTTAAWAGRQRDQADALDRILAPFSPAPVEPPA